MRDRLFVVMSVAVILFAVGAVAVVHQQDVLSESIQKEMRAANEAAADAREQRICSLNCLQSEKAWIHVEKIRIIRAEHPFLFYGSHVDAFLQGADENKVK